MKRKLQWMLVLLLIPLMIQKVEAQGKPSEKETVLLTSTDMNSQQYLRQISLINVLSNLEDHFNVTFLYKNEVVKNKFLFEGEVRIGAETGQELSQILRRLGITYRKIDNETYVLLSRKQNLNSSLKTIELQETVNGRVTDLQTGEALPGVNILVKGTSSGTATDIDGHFELTVESLQDTLVFSYIGYESQEIAINDREELDIELVPGAIMGDELVVVGYGRQREGSLISAVSQIDSETIQTTTSSSLAQKIQGKVPGLQIRQNSGQPGSFDTNINIRGFGGSPLYIIDGIPRSGSAEFQMLNPEDIESISVLKDASAAIYGIRAANGVIIVTTKKGIEGQTQFSYKGSFGVQSPTDIPDMSTASQWAQIRNDAAMLGTGNPFFSREILQNYIDGAPGFQSTNWYDVTMKKQAMQSNHNLSASGGNERIQYHISGGNYNEQGLLKTDAINYERYSIRSNVTAKLTDHFETTVLVSGTVGNRKTPVDDFFNIYKGTRNSLPTERPYANGNENYPSVVSSELNPVVLSDPNAIGYNEHTDKIIQTSLDLNYEAPFLKGLSMKATMGYDYTTYFNKILNKSFRLYTYEQEADEYESHLQREGTEAIYNYDSDFDRFTFQGQVTYETTIKGDHNLKGLLVYEQQQTWARWTRAKRYYDFYTNDQINFGGLDDQETGGLEDESARLSYVGRINYDFRDTYLFEFAFRQDGSYRYHPDERWGFFPVGSIGWRISEESFLRDVNWLTDLKLRASYGVVGEDAGSPFQYIAGFSTSGGGGYEFVDGEYTVGASSPDIVNKSLTWFTSRILDVGFDLTMWDGRFDFEFDLYQRNRDGLLAHRDASLPNTFGGELPQENLNKDQVRGLDLAIGYNSSVGNFQYGIEGNFNYARTKNTYVERGPFLNSMDRWRNGSTGRYDDVEWGYNYEGQFQDAEEIIHAPVQNGTQGNVRELPGDYRYEDVNNDGVIDGNDTQPLFWDGTPKMFYGLTLRGAWKGFDINMLFQGAAKYSIRFQELYAEILAYKGLNTPAYFFDRWRKADPYNPNSEWIPGEWPASRLNSDVGMLYAESEVWRRDASYVRLKSMELGYSFQPNLLAQTGLDGLRVYVNAHNVFTITDPFVKPFDPEKIEGAYNAGFNYPLQRSFNVGVTINF